LGFGHFWEIFKGEHLSQSGFFKLPLKNILLLECQFL
jgi:hypothetical protein